MTQKQAFLASEGDRYFERNLSNQVIATTDPVLVALDRLALKPRKVLEIGCSDGWRLRHFKGAKCAGIDPSAKAIATADSGMDLRVGTADQLPFVDASFDLVIFGFCLYLVDPALHFRCVAEADRVLSDGGSIVIYDFIPQKTYYNDYSHLAGLRSHKMQFAKYFLASPAYELVYRHIDMSQPIDSRIGADVLLKDQKGAFQKNPY